MRLHQSVDQSLEIEQELAARVSPQVQEHWNEKILGGIVPTEIKNLGPVDPTRNDAEFDKLETFESQIVSSLLSKRWKQPEANLPRSTMYYVGIGRGGAFGKVAAKANLANYNVVGCDTCSVGCDNGTAVLGNNKDGVNNSILFADIAILLDKKYLSVKKGDKLILPRVLDILDKQDKEYKRRAKKNRKMARTARRIGRLLDLTDTLLIYPCPEDNPGAVWGDTTPHPLEEVVKYIKYGHGREPKVEKLGRVDFYGHIYTAVLISPIEGSKN